jgi:ABC-type uncharacterized transport system substrate-binding protein
VPDKFVIKGELYKAYMRWFAANGHTYALASNLEARFADLTTQALDGLIVITDAEFDAGFEQIVRLASESHLPTMYEHRAFVEAGGLMSYGPDIDRLSIAPPLT